MKGKYSPRSSGSLLLLAGLLVFSACGGSSLEAVEADSTEADKEETSPGLWTSLFPTTYTVPEGTRLQIRLGHSVSSDGSSSGDEFKGTLEDSLVVDGQTLAPKGSEVSGYLEEVEDSKRVKGRAEVVMVLGSLKIGDEEYGLDTHPLTIRAAATKKKDAIAIGASSAVGAVVGAIAGGGDAAAKGAAIGAGAGTGYVLLTKGKEVKLGSEARLSFTLSDDLDLPAYEAE